LYATTPLTGAVNDLSKETTALTDQQHLVTTKLEGMGADLSLCREAIEKTTSNVTAVNDALSEFLLVITEAQEKQRPLPLQGRFFETTNPNTAALRKEPIAPIKTELDEAEALLKSMGAWQPMTVI
jgi:uncharacterized protein (DUF342 family)